MKSYFIDSTSHALLPVLFEDMKIFYPASILCMYAYMVWPTLSKLLAPTRVQVGGVILKSRNYLQCAKNSFFKKRKHIHLLR